MRRLRSLGPFPHVAILVALLAAPAAATLGAQVRATRDAEVRATPDGAVIATVQSGTTWEGAGARGGFTRVTLDGWVDASLLAGRRDSFPASIGGSGTVRLRAEPSLNGRILGMLEAGAGLRIAERRDGWARVRRDAWILSSAVAPAPARTASGPARAAADPAPTKAAGSAGRGGEPPRGGNSSPGAASPSAGAAAAATEPAASDEPVREGMLRAAAAVPLRRAPGTAPIGALERGAVVDPVARDRGWVRVRIDAWVPESLFVPADSSFVNALTAADLRLDPEFYRGRTVRWTVQVVSLQTADPLRRALAADEPYLLAMGPEGENAILYLAVPPSLLEQARGLPPLAEVVVTARVRNGRSQPTGAPVLDLLSLVRR